ncbi:MAG: LLM class flavin-dependent oxidoreductase [Propionicimonas sp.]
MKRIGFLSFGHWSGGHGSHTRSAADALLQSIDLAVAAEDLGADGAYACASTTSRGGSRHRFRCSRRWGRARVASSWAPP